MSSELKYSLGTYVKFLTPYGFRLGKITGAENNTYIVRFGYANFEKHRVAESDILEIVDNKGVASAIDRNISGVLEVTPEKLRDAFADALGVKDAAGWKTGEEIIKILWGLK